MIPKRLKIQGLYSYQQAVEIDFDTLLEARLFGIFGSVGSGKSALLEAMTYAIFGDTERLSTKGQGYNMMNLQSNRLFIEFDFEAGDKVFRSQTERKRKKDFESVSAPDRQAYIQKDGAWIPTEFSELKNSLGGLSYDNFRRTIIIPQGKFQEFLQLTPGQQSTMLKELFNLNQYDLGEATGRLLKATQFAHTDKLGRLEELNNGDRLTVEEVNSKLTKANTVKKEIGRKMGELEKLIQVIQLAKQRHDELAVKQQELQMLNEQSVEMEMRTRRLSRFEKIRDVIGERLTRFKKLEEEIDFREESLLKLRSDYRQAKEIADAQKISAEGLEKNLKESTKVNERIEKLSLRIEQLLYEEKKNQVREISRQTEQKKEALELQIEEILNSQEALSKEISATKENYQKSEGYLEVEKWVVSSKALTETLENANAERDSVQRKLLQQKGILRPDGADSDDPLTWKKLLRKREASAKTDLENYRETTGTFMHAEHLASLSRDLKEDEACPLCGATHHPAPFETDSVEEGWESKLKKKELDHELAKTQLVQMELGLKQLDFLEKELQSREAQLKVKLEDRNKYEKAYPFEDLIPRMKLDRLPELLGGRAALFTQLQSLEQKAQRYGSELEAKRISLREIAQQATDQKVELSKLSGQLEALFKNDLPEDIQVLSDQEKVMQRLTELKSQPSVDEQDVERAKQMLQTAEKECAALVAVGNEKKEQLERLKVDRKTLSDEMDAILQKEQWGEISDAIVELESRLNVISEREILQAFHEKESNLKSRVNELTIELQKAPYDSKEETRQVENAILLKQEQESLTSKHAQLQLQLKQLKVEQKRRSELEKELKALSARQDGLQSIAKLMRGNGFVNYVSSVYLREIVVAANLRFRKLSRQSLELEIDANNTFQIRDFLNGGKLRDARTLSGGQTFQASLCLALALAERIQTETGAHQQFFFLDEGFGSLDEESLQTVFETLKELRKENRVVGIISHVTALQQEIPAHLLVTRHEERGSEVELRV